jgi:hypothetical protein
MLKFLDNISEFHHTVTAENIREGLARALWASRRRGETGKFSGRHLDWSGNGSVRDLLLRQPGVSWETIQAAHALAKANDRSGKRRETPASPGRQGFE